MHAYVGFHRRMVLLAYHRFLAADRSLQKAQSAALSLISRPVSQKMMLLGDPGSRMRKLHERRDRALVRLKMLRQVLHEDQKSKRQRPTQNLLFCEMRPTLSER
jgi:hypothetical protein